MSKKLKVLLIDDDAAVVSFLTLKLSKYFDIVSTTEPAEVVELAGSEKPDVILCDINMPGMKGDEVAFNLGNDRDTGRIPIVYLSAVVPADGTTELDDSFGGHLAISKSAPLSELLRVIEQVTAR
ncbi:MAG: response regulator [Comamonadaceae bacterium]|nr:MAG: response regulator [Comamonadaceae bacterium]